MPGLAPSTPAFHVPLVTGFPFLSLGRCLLAEVPDVALAVLRVPISRTLREPAVHAEPVVDDHAVIWAAVAEPTPG